MTQLKNVKFDLIRYANCWEDADILTSALGNESGRKFLSIASGGDNSFSLLITDPKLVVACDINPVQLFVVELKKEAIRLLSRKEYLQFIGFETGKNRLEIYKKIRLKLSESTQRFWDENLTTIESGIVHGGKFERYLRFFGKRILPLIHSRKKVEKLLAPKSEKAQADFFKKEWNTFRWRMLFKVFFSRFLLGKCGRDPQFLKEVKISVADYLLTRTSEHFSSVGCQKNWMLNYILKGDFDGQLPHYVQVENYERIRKNIDRLTIWQGFAERASATFGRFDAFNLSNIFEYMDEMTFQKVRDGLLASANENARFAYWNLMVPRQISGCEDLRFGGENDKGFFYQKFHIQEAKNMPLLSEARFAKF